MKKLLLAFVFLAAFFVAGCTVSQEPLADQSQTPPTVEDLQEDLTGLDTLEQDLDVSDLEGIEDDLNVDF